MAREVILKVTKPLRTRCGDLAPPEGLSFPKLRKPLRAENRGFLELRKIVSVFFRSVVYAKFDGFGIFGDKSTF